MTRLLWLDSATPILELQKTAGSVLSNLPAISAFLSFLLAQFLKVVVKYYHEGKWDWHRMVESGGMPSSHAALSMGLTAAVGLSKGLGDPLFAACMVFTSIVMYDASGVRLQAGRQAVVLNQIISELPPDHPASDQGSLKEAIGHTPLQVAVGAVMGAAVAYVCFIISQAAAAGPAAGGGASLALPVGVA